jgi:hypothetical protein
MPRKKQRWAIGDIFVVELMDGTYTIGQIVGQERPVLNSVSIALFEVKCGSQELAKNVLIPQSRLFSVLFATRDLLDSGKWAVVGTRSILIRPEQFPFEHLRDAGFVGAKIIGSAIVTAFLNAYYGLAPWDAWKDPNYLDSFLVTAEKKPRNLILRGRA